MATFRPATESDLAAIYELWYRSKASWGYDEAFMQRVGSSVAFDKNYIENWPVYVCEVNGKLAGFYGFREIQSEIFLDDMFLEPEYIGKGLGRSLWDHALQTARECGYQQFLIESDPNAEQFYLKMGAKRIGDIESPSSGRTLPLMRYELWDEAAL